MHHNYFTLTIPYSNSNNLPSVVAEPGICRYANFYCRECDDVQFTSLMSVSKMHEKLGKTSLEGGDDHLSKTERELLMWHRKLGHRSMDFIKQLARDGQLPKRLLTARNTPVCPDCKFGEQSRKPVDTSRGLIDDDDIAPGDTVSGDQLEANMPGLIITNKGKRSRRRHHVATVWVDHFSRFITAHTHELTSIDELLKSKAELEVFANKNSVTIKKFRTNNGAFISKRFDQEMKKAKQKLTACRVGAH